MVAHLADGVFFGFLLVLVIAPAAALSDTALIVAGILMLTVGHVAYFVLLQRRDGQTPGKRIVDVRVVDASGETPSTKALTIRSIPLLFEYIYLIAFVSMQTSDYRQRLGDRLGKTYVIRARVPDPGPAPPPLAPLRAEAGAHCELCGAKLVPEATVCPGCGRIELTRT